MKFYGRNRNNKYGAKKTEHAGHSFGSKLEAAVYDLLMLEKLAGVIASIQAQDSVYLTDARILYKPDFKVTPVHGDPYWVEAKGIETPVYAIKLRLWRHYGPGVLHVYKGNWSRPKLTETVLPKGLSNV